VVVGLGEKPVWYLRHQAAAAAAADRIPCGTFLPRCLAQQKP
jgi:hypothetical protein